MPRLSRRVFPGLPHHVVQRGNRREDVFFSDADRLAYLDGLAEYCAAGGVQIVAYCLMTNHVHLVVVPRTESALKDAFQPLHTRYAMRVNRTRGLTGRVWQGRFFSAVLDETYFYAAVRYVELNPVRARMVGKASDFRWSSAPAHCGLGQDPLLVAPNPWLPDLNDAVAWTEWLAEGDQPDHVATLRQNTRREIPCGSETFVCELERRVGRPLRPRPRGRPAKASGKGQPGNPSRLSRRN